MMRRLAWLVLVLLLVAIAVGSLAPGASRWLPWYYPQWTHVVVYGAVAALLHVALGCGANAFWRTVIVTGLLGLGVELGQLLVPAREAGLEDALLNVLGALLGAGAVEVVQRFRQRTDGAAVGHLVRPPSNAATSAAEQVALLGSDRLIAAWPILRQRGAVSSAVAALLSQIDRRSVPLGNAPAADLAVLEALSAKGIRCLLLKGTLLAHTVYEAPSQRARGDTDMLIATAEREPAERVLVEIGLVRSWEVTAKTSDTQDQWQGVIDGNNVVIDLHWALLNHPAFTELFAFDALWQARQPVKVAGFQAFGLGRADALIHAALHYFAHHGDEFRPAQWLLDGDLLWRAMDDAERDGLVAKVKRIGVSGLVHAYLRACVTRFGSPIEPETLCDLEASGQGEWRTRLLDLDGKPVRELLFMLRARPTWKARLAHLRALLFPSREYMRWKYPAVRWWGMPWAYLKRIFGGVVR